MTMDAHRPDLLLGVVGAGAMGRGIAQVAAVGGIEVRLHDSRTETGREAVAFIDGMLARAVDKKRMSRAQAGAALARVRAVDNLSELAPCHVVIEAVVEDLAVKRRVFRALEDTVSDEAILATNTSSLSVTAIAAACRHPERIAGMHFFNPVPLMKLVEVIAGVRSAAWLSDTLVELGRRMGLEPVRVQDVPGFLVNQVGRGYGVEAAHMVTEGVADFVTIDRILRDAGGFRMGPFELLDLTALDVSFPASQAIFEQHFFEPRYRPAQLMQARMSAGRLGRKSGEGFYRYENGKALVPDEPPAPRYDGRKVWLSRDNAEGYVLLDALLDTLAAPRDHGVNPEADALILIAPLGEDATHSALKQKLDPRRTIAVDTLPGLERRRTLMTTPATDPAFRDAAHGLLAGDGVPVSVIRDSPGFVLQRIVAMIVNIACAVAEQRVATPEDIDTAVTLGLGYPFAPLAFGDELGAAKVLRILDAVHSLSRDPRYRPTLWLQRRARLGLSLTAAD